MGEEDDGLLLRRALGAVPDHQALHEFALDLVIRHFDVGVGKAASLQLTDDIIHHDRDIPLPFGRPDFDDGLIDFARLQFEGGALFGEGQRGGGQQRGGQE